MPSAAPLTSARPRSLSLKREIVAILVFKVLALIVLYFLFFDQRPEITPQRVERRVLDSTAAGSAATPANPESEKRHD